MNKLLSWKQENWIRCSTLAWCLYSSAVGHTDSISEQDCFMIAPIVKMTDLLTSCYGFVILNKFLYTWLLVVKMPIKIKFDHCTTLLPPDVAFKNNFSSFRFLRRTCVHLITGLIETKLSSNKNKTQMFERWLRMRSQLWKLSCLICCKKSRDQL